MVHFEIEIVLNFQLARRKRRKRKEDFQRARHIVRSAFNVLLDSISVEAAEIRQYLAVVIRCQKIGS